MHTKGILQPSLEAASHLSLALKLTHTSSPVPPFLLVQSVSPKDIVESDITTWKLHDSTDNFWIAASMPSSTDVHSNGSLIF